MRPSIIYSLMGVLAVCAALSGLPGASGLPRDGAGASEVEDAEEAGVEAGVAGASGGGGGGVGLEYDDDYDAAGAQDDGASGHSDSDDSDVEAQEMTTEHSQGMDASSFGSTGTDAAEEEPAADSLESLAEAAAAQKAGRFMRTKASTTGRLTLNRRTQAALLCERCNPPEGESGVYVPCRPECLFAVTLQKGCQRRAPGQG